MTKDSLRPLYLAVVFLLLSCAVHAKPTPQEKIVYIVEQKNADEAFNLELLSQTQPRAAERVRFEAKEKADRLTFIRSLAGLPSAERSEKLSAYHVSALSRRKDFENKVQKIPEFKEVKVEELVKKRRKYEQDKRQKALTFYG